MILRLLVPIDVAQWSCKVHWHQSMSLLVTSTTMGSPIGPQESTVLIRSLFLHVYLVNWVCGVYGALSPAVVCASSLTVCAADCSTCDVKADGSGTDCTHCLNEFALKSSDKTCVGECKVPRPQSRRRWHEFRRSREDYQRRHSIYSEGVRSRLNLLCLWLWLCNSVLYYTVYNLHTNELYINQKYIAYYV